MAAPQPMFLGKDFTKEHKTPSERILDEDFEIIEISLKVERKSPYKKTKGLKIKQVRKIIKIGIGLIVLGTVLVVSKKHTNSNEINSTIETNADEENILKNSNAEINLVEVSTPTIEIGNEIRENEPVISKIYDMSFQGRSKNIPTREYSVKDTYETSIPKELFDLIIKYSIRYGFDPFIFRALGTHESHLTHNIDPNNAAIGIYQIEKTNFGGSVTAFNYESNIIETVDINYNNVSDLEKNIQIGAMLFQRKLEKYGDLYIAIQSYNYGEAMMDHLINLSGIEKPTYEQMRLYIDDVHNNPRKYHPSWEYDTYGDNLYPQHVLQYHPGNITYYNIDGNIVLQDVDKNINLGTYSVISNESNDLVLKNNITNEIIKLENTSISLNNEKKGFVN